MSDSQLAEVQIYAALAGIFMCSICYYNQLKIAQIQDCPWWRSQGLKMINFIDVNLALYSLTGVVFMSTNIFEIYKFIIK